MWVSLVLSADSLSPIGARTRPTSARSALALAAASRGRGRRSRRRSRIIFITAPPRRRCFARSPARTQCVPFALEVPVQDG